MGARNQTIQIRPTWNMGNIPAHITAKIVIASAARLTDVRQFCLVRNRIAEIRVPACPIPIQKTKFTIGHPHMAVELFPHTPTPVTTQVSQHADYPEDRQQGRRDKQNPPEQGLPVLYNPTNTVGDPAIRPVVENQFVPFEHGALQAVRRCGVGGIGFCGGVTHGLIVVVLSRGKVSESTLVAPPTFSIVSFSSRYSLGILRFGFLILAR